MKNMTVRELYIKLGKFMDENPDKKENPVLIVGDSGLVDGTLKEMYYAKSWGLILDVGHNSRVI